MMRDTSGRRRSPQPGRRDARRTVMPGLAMALMLALVVTLALAVAACTSSGGDDAADAIPADGSSQAPVEPPADVADDKTEEGLADVLADVLPPELAAAIDASFTAEPALTDGPRQLLDALLADLPDDVTTRWWIHSHPGTPEQALAALPVPDGADVAPMTRGSVGAAVHRELDLWEPRYLDVQGAAWLAAAREQADAWASVTQEVAEFSSSRTGVEVAALLDALERPEDGDGLEGADGSEGADGFEGADGSDDADGFEGGDGFEGMIDAVVDAEVVAWLVAVASPLVDMERLELLEGTYLVVVVTRQ